MTENDPTDIHAGYLHWVRDASAYRLAEIAECGAPDSRTSLGAEILEEVRDAVVNFWVSRRFDWETDRNDGDITPECAEEGIIPQESHQRALLFVDLCAYTEESEFTSDGEWTGTIEDIMVDAISQITDRAARALIIEIRKDFDETWVCPGCGDTGTPHVCLPGECNGSEETQEAYRASQATSEPADTATPTDTTQDAGEPASVAPSGPVVPSDTQAFMSRMDAINADEFGSKSWITTHPFWFLTVCGSVGATVGLITWATLNLIGVL